MRVWQVQLTKHSNVISKSQVHVHMQILTKYMSVQVQVHV